MHDPAPLTPIAVLERRAGIKLGDKDVYVSTVGGVRLTEPGADLAIALAIASAATDRAIPHTLAAFGEISLAGKRNWVVSNFKENQLRYMRLGQPAEIKVDAYPDLKLKGRVESFSPGTGNSFSVLPAENATGNWVKVVQRLPVEISIDNPPADVPLHAGLSVEVTVDTGHVRHLFGPDTPPTTPAANAQARAAR